jgi:hypothetical protein
MIAPDGGAGKGLAAGKEPATAAALQVKNSPPAAFLTGGITVSLGNS